MMELIIWIIAVSATFTALHLASRLARLQGDIKTILNQTPPQAGGEWWADLTKPLSDWEE